MSGNELTTYLKDPAKLSRDDRQVLKALTSRFPYCSVAQILYACNLYIENDLEYSSQLGIAAAYASSREKIRVLFDDVKSSRQQDNMLQASGFTLQASETVEIQETKKEKSIPQLTREEIIEKFIREEPTITPAKAAFYSPSDLASSSNLDDEEIVSETLAELFIRQGNITKAVKIYERLSLLIPEKSVYFAALIEKLKR